MNPFLNYSPKERLRQLVAQRRGCANRSHNILPSGESSSSTKMLLTSTNRGSWLSWDARRCGPRLERRTVDGFPPSTLLLLSEPVLYCPYIGDNVVQATLYLAEPIGHQVIACRRAPDRASASTRGTAASTTRCAPARSRSRGPPRSTPGAGHFRRRTLHPGSPKPGDDLLKVLQGVRHD